jgi:hypothetical protein
VLFIGLGCGALLLLGGAGAAWFFYQASQVARAGFAVASAVAIAADGGVPLTVPGPAGSGVPLTIPDGALNTGGPTCEQAAACCRAVVAKTGGNADMQATCEAMRQAPQIGCVQALETYRRTAPLVGASCP